MYRIHPSPVGDLTLITDGTRLTHVAWGEIDDRTRGGPSEHPVLTAAAQQLDEYFAGRRRDFDLPLGPKGTPFQLAAWQQLRTIPFGHTITYAEQARRLGDVNKSRAVGGANARNPIPIIVPCHRVIGTSGSLTGFAGGVDRKAWLLAHEQRVAGHFPPVG